MKKAFIDTWGCRTRRLDVTRIKRFFIENGWEVVENHLERNLILILIISKIHERFVK